MRIKVIQPNKNGKIELTVKELQDLLNEAYHQGWNDKPYNYYGNSYPYVTYLGNAIDPKEDSSTDFSIDRIRGNTSDNMTISTDNSVSTYTTSTGVDHIANT